MTLNFENLNEDLQDICDMVNEKMMSIYYCLTSASITSIGSNAF